MSKRALNAFSLYKETNIFLRGMVPMIGFKSDIVTYERSERLAGESKYPLKKMLALAWEGITSLSIQPIRMITWLGAIVFGISLIMIIYSLISFFLRLDCKRLVKPFMFNLGNRRTSAPCNRCYRRIHRKDLYGNKAQTKIYC